MTQNRDDCKQFCWQVAAIGRPFWFCDVAVTLDQRHDAKQGRLRAVHQQVAAIGHLFWSRDMVVAAAGYQKHTEEPRASGSWELGPSGWQKGGCPDFPEGDGPSWWLGLGWSTRDQLGMLAPESLRWGLKRWLAKKWEGAPTSRRETGPAGGLG